MEFRIEKDTMGEVKVPVTAYYGAQTQRSIDTVSYTHLDVYKRQRLHQKQCSFL